MSQSARYVSGNDTQNSVGNEKHNQHQSGIKTDADVPTLTDVFDKKLITIRAKSVQDCITS